MYVSVTLSDDDVDYLDRYAEKHDLPSRSAVVRRAVGLLRASELESAYKDAWNEWAVTGEAALWDSTGITNDPGVAL